MSAGKARPITHTHNICDTHITAKSHSQIRADRLCLSDETDDTKMISFSEYKLEEYDK